MIIQPELKFWHSPTMNDSPLASSSNGYTVPFQLICQSHVTGPYGPALILVQVTGHIDFGRMGKMVQKKSFNYLRYISFYRYDIWLSLSQIKFLSVANSVCHRSYRKWSQRQNATAVSLVTPPDESIEMVQYHPSVGCRECFGPEFIPSR